MTISHLSISFSGVARSLGRLAVPTQVRVDESRHDSTLMLSVDNKRLESKEKPSPEFDKTSPLPDTSVASGSLFGSLAALDKVLVCPPNLRISMTEVDLTVSNPEKL